MCLIGIFQTEMNWSWERKRKKDPNYPQVLGENSRWGGECWNRISNFSLHLTYFYNLDSKARQEGQRRVAREKWTMGNDKVKFQLVPVFQKPVTTPEMPGKEYEVWSSLNEMKVPGIQSFVLQSQWTVLFVCLFVYLKPTMVWPIFNIQLSYTRRFYLKLSHF